jgi:DeoR/GlpR family transcriptional regulator of sugar metabolism
MLIAERQREILALVERESSVRVTTLARMFGVTEETIRRDLERLDSEGKLVRSHGGAISSRLYGRETPFNEREGLHSPEKASIARRALALIASGDSIILDASTTALHLARILPDEPLTVLTNSIAVCAELAGRGQITVLCTGGRLSSTSLSLTGARSEQMLADYHVHSVFFSCAGVDVEHGLSDTSEAQAALKRIMLSVADRAYLLVDKSKFGVRALTRFATLAQIESVVTSADSDDIVLEQLNASGVDVSLAPAS